ncbi:MAG: hypothetical protein ACRD4D_10300 [Candidatus Acidiferrales bacterium]
MKLSQLVFSLVVLISFALALPASSFAQSGEQPQQEQAKKKTRRVWTNDDFGSGSRAAEEKKEAPGPEEPQPSAEELFAELDQARISLASQEKELELDRKQYEGQLQRLRDADNDYDRDAYRTSMEVAERHLAQREQAVEELKARIAELEQLTSGMKRPARKAQGPQGPPGTPVKADAVEVVQPGGGPVPKKEPPPEP